MLHAILLVSLGVVTADYSCVCNYNVEQSVLPWPSGQAQPIGYVYEFDCKPLYEIPDLDTQSWESIAYEGQVAYLQVNEGIQEMMCVGNISAIDLVKTSTQRPSTTTIGRTGITEPNPGTNLGPGVTEPNPGTNSGSGVTEPNSGTNSGSGVAGPNSGINSGSGVTGPNSGNNSGSGVTEPNSGTNSGSGVTGPNSGNNFGSGVTGPNSGSNYVTGVTGPNSEYNSGSGVTGPNSGSNSGSGVTGPNSGSNSGSGVTGPNSGSNSGSGVTGPNSGSNSGSVVTGSNSGTNSGSGVTGPNSVTNSGSGVTGPNSGSNSGSGVTRPNSGSNLGSGVTGPNSGTNSGSGVTGPNSGTNSGSGVTGPNSGNNSGSEVTGPNSGTNYITRITSGSNYVTGVTWSNSRTNYVTGVTEPNSGGISSYSMPSTQPSTLPLITFSGRTTISPLIIRSQRTTTTRPGYKTSKATPFLTPTPIPTTKSTTQTTTTHSTLPPVTGAISLCPSQVIEYTREDRGALTQYGNKCYELVPVKLIWTKAELDCRAKGGHLLGVHTRGLQDYIYGWVNRFVSVQGIWLGISNRRPNGLYEWTSGERTGATFWYPTSNTTSTAERCGAMMFTRPWSGKWVPVGCGTTTPSGDIGSQYEFICEYPIETRIPIGHNIIGK